MKLLRVVVVVGLLLSFASLYAFDIGQVGFSAVWSNVKTSVSAGSHPIFLFWTALAVWLFVELMRRKVSAEIVGIPGLSRRATAFLIDFYFSLMTLSSVGALIPLWLEAARTGHFAWSFERDYGVMTDPVFSLPIVFITMGLMFFYFAFPLTRGRQTVGCFVMRLKVTPPFGDEGCFTLREAVRRTWYEFKGLCMWPFWVKRGTDSMGRTWYDIETDCRVVLVEYK